MQPESNNGGQASLNGQDVRAWTATQKNKASNTHICITRMITAKGFDRMQASALSSAFYLTQNLAQSLD